MDGIFLGGDRPFETRGERQRAGRHRADRDDFPDTSKRWNRTLAAMLTVLLLVCGALATAGFLLVRQ
ncbi:hypothetical protein [Rugosimonospora africana]|uniref:Uncharacterized protein n=1 Tax=Rugosimonospora africana TaxID=556532 RepID=A0A8J3QUH3_9ACTN|nr:hypothetical protein [Rugosimonospora africana]GIH16322.1 hypothetical protein Raf01_44940 [Rugosimonospora africana]